MHRKELIFLASIVLTLCAGVVVGRLSARLPAEVARSSNPGPAPIPAPRSQPQKDWLKSQLGMSQDQSDKMDAVWAEARIETDKINQERHHLDVERNQAFDGLLSFSQAYQYAQLKDQYADMQWELNKEHDQIIANTMEKTKSFLNEDQQKKLNQLTVEHPRETSRGRGGPPGPSTRRATTRSASGM